MYKKLFYSLVFSVLVNHSVFGGESLIDKNMYTIGGYSVEEIENSGSYLKNSPIPRDPLTEIVFVVDTLIAVGKKIYTVVEAGKPILNTEFNNLSVLPKLDNGELADPFYDLDGWSYPVHKKYKISFKNLYGIEVVSFVYGASMQYGGSFNGKGNYILGAHVYADSINVLWGFDVNAKVKTLAISNMGSKDEPVGAVQLILDTTIKSVLVEHNHTHVFHFNGKGKISSNK
ncbi:MAG: hypothetical protein CME61_03660 [Halobacteriovoraceae bacterium]|nr:hypothetical protein [Halobacteriovoraceae bacterium]